MQNQKGISTLTGIIIIIIAIVVIFGGVFAYEYFATKSQPKIILSQQNRADGWKTYTNKQYGFELEYPASANVSLVNHIPPHGTDLILPNSNFIQKDGSIGNILNFSIFAEPFIGLENYVLNDVSSVNKLNSKYGVPLSTYKKININGVDAYEVDSPGVSQQSDVFIIYIQNSTHVFFLHYTGDDDSTAQRIISTFKID